MYFLDTGLAAYLCRWPNAETLEKGAMDGKEIDLLFVQGDRIYPVEIKKAKAPDHADKNFSVLNKLKKEVQPGVILCMADEMLPFSRDVWYFPVAGI